MELEDIPEVAEIERQSFAAPWPMHAYRRELQDNRLSRYVVAYWISPGEGEREPQRVGARATREAAAQSPVQRSLVRRALSQLFQGLGRRDHRTQDWTIVGYAGLWLMLDEGHITTIAVRPTLRGQGIGELLLIGLIDLAAAAGANYVTLEVRVSNAVAQTLYKKYGFREEGLRKRYYSDNREDALIMWSEPLGSAVFQKRLVSLKAALEKKLQNAPPPEPHDHPERLGPPQQ
ncbi:MAG: ribosomal protein S18-alanine N-acetyltransferase [Chloroflexi bacterium]|nr:ribosomal protein S18-alanine N-acetyltransferase [Chloroflexota bacterium]